VAFYPFFIVYNAIFPGKMPPRTLTSQEEIARLAALMPVADPNKDNGAFVSLTNKDVVDWLNLLGVREMDPNMRDVKNAREQREKGIKKLRLALWDVQRSVVRT
jgi:hypothetical protein